jgi:hypothetical protein
MPYEMALAVVSDVEVVSGQVRATAGTDQN